jgi:hypothetical protein
MVSNEYTNLIESILNWWGEHQHDTQGDHGEYNTYEETPEFVTLAESIKNSHILPNTIEDYMRVKYVEKNADPRWRQAEMTTINRNRHLYFVFSVQNDFLKKKKDGNDYIIRDLENGVRAVYEDIFCPLTGEEFFDYCYQNDEVFRKYVDTDGKCLENN